MPSRLILSSKMTSTDLSMPIPPQESAVVPSTDKTLVSEGAPLEERYPQRKSRFLRWSVTDFLLFTILSDSAAQISGEAFSYSICP